LIKHIPVGAGLGGGSSDAAAILACLNRCYNNPFARHRLLRMAADLGADVPFFIDAKPAFVQGFGDRLSPYHGLNPMGIVLVYPGFGISTRWAFANFTLRLTKCEKKIRNFPFKNGAFCVARHLSNDLESVVLKQYPVIARIKDQLLQLGAMGALMSGSGSSVFGLFADKAAAQKAVVNFETRNSWQVFAAEIIQ
jgi:4-diphosphocytidyl-2-C-methyl-D-erythritol kinase